MLEPRSNTAAFEVTFIQYFSDAVDALRKAYFNLQNLKLDPAVAEVYKTIDTSIDVANGTPLPGAATVAAGLNIKKREEQDAYDRKQEKRIKNFHQIVQGFSQAEIQKVIKIVARELIRIYEVQINLLAPASVEEMAKCAVNTGISFLKDAKADSQSFHRNALLKAIVTCNSNHNYKQYPFLLTNTENKCKVFDVFTKPGIQQNFEQGHTKFYTDQNLQPEKYGYRTEVRFYDQTGGVYKSFNEVDSAKKLIPRFEPHKNLFYLGKIEDLLTYQDYLQQYRSQPPKEKPQSFNIFLKELYNLENPIKIVYRDVFPQGLNLDQGDFCGTDFYGIRIENLSAKNANFEGCIFTDAQFIHCDFENSNFIDAQLDFTMLVKGTSFQHTCINNANFNYSQLDDSVNFNYLPSTTGFKYEGSNISRFKNTISPYPQKEKTADITNIAFDHATRVPGDNTLIKVEQELFKNTLPASHDFQQNIQALLALQMGAVQATNALTKTIENKAYVGTVPPNTAVSQGIIKTTMDSPHPPTPDQQPLNRVQNSNSQITNSFNPPLSQAQLLTAAQGINSSPRINSTETQIKDKSAENQKGNNFAGK